MSRFTTIEDVWSYLDQIPMFSTAGAGAANFGLDKIRSFCEELGNPHMKFKSIHVAGTNGKGTTCYLLESVYTEAGYKTGMFTSPHLLSYQERFRVSGQTISEERLLEFFQTAEPLFEKIRLTYFEISTALAFWYFAEEEVDIAIIETGLGGRLDSTNIIQPEASVITSIGLDHQDILGNTLSEIATEKAGIIKTNTPVIIGNITEAPMKAIRQKADQESSEVLKATSLNPVFESGIIHLNGEEKLNTHFTEEINKWNVAMVWLTVQALKKQYPVADNSFRKALESFPGVPARFEKLHPDRNWYFSGSHNEQAVRSLVETVSGIDHKHKVLIFSMMKDKVKQEVMNEFRVFDEVYFYEQKGERAARSEDIQAFLEVKTLSEAGIHIFLNELKTSLVIFAGSFYFYPTVKRWLSE